MDIERKQSETHVLVDDGIQQRGVPLNGSLISFGSAVDNNDIHTAMGILEELPPQAPGADGEAPPPLPPPDPSSALFAVCRRHNS